ncbi:MAG: lysylphosphatidylglycerol synthase transmembrane domain-containing protein, partial [Phycisphaerales bacterium]
MTTRDRQLLKLFVRILITTGLLAWVFSQIELGQLWQTMKMARWQFLIAVWVLTAIIFWIRSIQMQLILKRQGCNVDCATIFGATAVTCLYGLIMPGMLSTGVKWYVLKKDTGKPGNVLSSMLYNQLSIMVVTTALGLAALMIANPMPLFAANSEKQWLLPVVCGMLLAAVLLAALLLWSNRVGGKIIKVLELLLRPFPGKIRQKGQEILDQIAVFQAAGWRFHLTVALISITGTLIGGVITYALAARSANIVAPVSVFVWLCAVVYILGRLPISVANLGVREVTLVGFLAIYSVEKSDALLMSMILFSALVVMAV